MSAAQRLYENGWIAYMRTDSVSLEPSVAAARGLIKEYGDAYMPESPRVYKGQECTGSPRAIRPAGEQFRSPSEAKSQLGSDEARFTSSLEAHGQPDVECSPSHHHGSGEGWRRTV